MLIEVFMLSRLSAFFFGDKQKSDDLIICCENNQDFFVSKSSSVSHKYRQINNIFNSVFISCNNNEIQDLSFYVDNFGKIVQYIDDLKASNSLPTRLYMRLLGFNRLQNDFEKLRIDVEGRLEKIKVNDLSIKSKINPIHDKEEQQLNSFFESPSNQDNVLVTVQENLVDHEFHENLLEAKTQEEKIILRENQSQLKDGSIHLPISAKNSPQALPENSKDIPILGNIIIDDLDDVEELVEERISDEGEKKFNDMLANFFYEMSPPSGEGEIVVTGRVMDDGMGDFIHLVDIAKEVREYYSNYKIQLVILADPKHKGKLQPPKGQEQMTHIAYSNGAYYEDKLSLFKDTKPLDLVKSASLVIVGPVSPDMYGAVSKELEAKGVFVCENDNTGAMRHYCGTVLQMGLSENNLGIMTKANKDYSWNMIKGDRLKQTLFDENSPLEKKNVFLSYLPEPKMAYRFIDQAVFFAESDKNIDIISPRNEHLTLDGLKSEINTEAWQDVGVGKITIISYVNGQKVEESLEFGREGREVRLVNIGQIKNNDFKILMKLSSPLAACTGDKSVGQAIQYGKIPFYLAPNHKHRFQSAIGNEIARYLSKESPFYLYYTQQRIEKGKRILNENREQIIKDAQIFGEKICEERSFNKIFLGTTNLKLYMLKYPQIEKSIKDLKKNYQSGKIELKTVLSELHKKVDSMSIEQSE